VQGTSLLMKRLPRKVWRGIHLTSFGTFWAATLHSTFAGTDASRPLYRWTAIAVGVTLLAAMVYRILVRSTPNAKDPGRGRGPSRVPDEVRVRRA